MHATSIAQSHKSRASPLVLRDDSTDTHQQRHDKRDDESHERVF
jgi:hypothetical protein